MNKQEQISILNAGWTLGNDCPYRCRQCYSAMVRVRGRNLCSADVDRIIGQLTLHGVSIVNLGGNEPLFTNGLNPRNSLLPYILKKLRSHQVKVGLTTAGISVNYLAENHSDAFHAINDVDVSLDSPFPEEHDVNRGAPLFRQGLKALGFCREAGTPHTIVMCGMNWNLSEKHLDGLMRLARETGSYFRINFLRPTQLKHFATMPTEKQFHVTVNYLASRCRIVEAGEPVACVLLSKKAESCPCGTNSLRIHSITPEGRVPVSPCVFLHNYRVGDLLTEDLGSILASAEFEDFRRRHREPEQIKGCNGCSRLLSCRGGCASRSYLTEKPGTIWRRDPYCQGPQSVPKEETTNNKIPLNDDNLVHRGYLCTLIFAP